MGGSTAKMAVFPVSCAQPTGKVLLQPIIMPIPLTGVAYNPRGMHFWGTHNTLDIKNPKWGTPDPRKISEFQKFIHPIQRRKIR